MIWTYWDKILRPRIESWKAFFEIDVGVKGPDDSVSGVSALD